MINDSVADSLLKEYESIAEALTLPDSGGCRVLAAAVKAQAQIIVTYNLKDFPSEALIPFTIEAQHPDDFFLNQCDLRQNVFLSVIKKIRLSLKRPPKTAGEYLGVLRKNSLAKTAGFLEDYVDII